MTPHAPPRRSAVRAVAVAAGVAITAPYAALAATQARAETAPASGRLDKLLQAFPDGMTAGQLDAVLAVVDEREIRAALRERLIVDLQARPAALPPDDGALELYMRRTAEVVAAYPGLPQAAAGAFARPRGLDPPLRPLALAASIAAVLAVGAGAMALARRALAGSRAGIAADPVTRAARLRRLALDALFATAEIVAFVVGVLIAYALVLPRHPLAPDLLLVVLRGALTLLVAERSARLVCRPDVASARPVGLGDVPARAVYRTVVTTVLLTVTAAVAVRVGAVLGMAPDDLAALALPLSVLPFAYLVALVWRHRRELAAGIARHLRLEGRQAPLLAAWPVLATAYIVGLWLVVSWGILTAQPDVTPRALASLLLLAVPLAGRLVQRPLARLYGLGEAELVGAPVAAPADDGAGQDRRHVRRLMRVVWLALVTLAIVATARIWGFDPVRDAGLSGFAIRLLFNVGVALLLGYIARTLVVRAINERLEAARREQGSVRAQRVATLLPLLRRFLQVVLVTVTGMIVLSSLGVDIGPLIAGAGVVGLAVGLGAQQTIADILAGVFFLLEDAFHLGDYVEVGSLRGTVEGISLRSLKLRHHRGAVHTLPFGQMQSLTNHTRDWALMRLEFRVAPGTDVGLVKRLVKTIGKELLADAEISPGFIEPLKSQGIRDVEDGALVLGVKFIAKPGTQFVIRREAYKRILDAFRSHGVELVGRGVVVKVEGPHGADGRVLGAATTATEAPRPAEAGAA